MTMRAEAVGALLFAIERHHGQMRKASAIPYVVHPVRVMQLAVEAAAALGLGEQVAGVIELAALLHDTIEDTDTTPEEVRERFGDRVLEVVLELTQDMSAPKAVRRQAMIEHCGSMSLEARVVKLADRLDNMRGIEIFDEAFITRYCAEAKEMAERMRGTAPTLEAAIEALIQKHSS